MRCLPESFALFPWDEYLPQLGRQVNLLHFSNVAPNVCSWTVLKEKHGLNRHPLVPLGIEIQMLEQTDKINTWQVKNKRGHCLGTSLEEYWYYHGWLSKTRSVRGSESLIFKHKYITNPEVTAADTIVQLANQFTSALLGNIASPLVASGIDHIQALNNIFSEAKG